jgi:hypothetical protein
MSPGATNASKVWAVVVRNTEEILSLLARPFSQMGKSMDDTDRITCSWLFGQL